MPGIPTRWRTCRAYGSELSMGYGLPAGGTQAGKFEYKREGLTGQMASSQRGTSPGVHAVR
jgi:hypothetical protein